MMNHKDFCAVNGEQKNMLPQKGVDDVLALKDFKKKMRCTFVIFDTSRLLIEMWRRANKILRNLALLLRSV